MTNHDNAEEVVDKVVNIRILYDAYVNGEHLCNAVSLSNKKVNDNTVCSIVFVLYNNTAVEKLDLSYNNITDDGAVVVSDVLKRYNSLQKVDISYNNIADDGAEAIGYFLKYNKTVKK